MRWTAMFKTHDDDDDDSYYCYCYYTFLRKFRLQLQFVGQWSMWKGELHETALHLIFRSNFPSSQG